MAQVVAKQKLKKPGLHGQLRNKNTSKKQRKFLSNTLKYNSSTENENWKYDTLRYFTNHITDIKLQKNIIKDLKRNFFKFLRSPYTDYIEYIDNKYKPNSQVFYTNVCNSPHVTNDGKKFSYKLIGSGNINSFCINGTKEIVKSNQNIVVNDILIDTSIKVFEIEIKIVGEKNG